MQHSLWTTRAVLGLVSFVFLAGCQRSEPEQSATAPPPPAPAAVVAKAPPPAPDYPTHVYFGDTHLHTALSLDAGVAGARLMPADAYRFAKGEEVTGASGQKAKLSRPLDFLAVTDHSDQMGLVTDLIAGKPEIIANPTAKQLLASMPADYRAYLQLGRFRNALLLDEAKHRPSAALSAFINRYELAAHHFDNEKNVAFGFAPQQVDDLRLPSVVAEHRGAQLGNRAFVQPRQFDRLHLWQFVRQI